MAMRHNKMKVGDLVRYKGLKTCKGLKTWHTGIIVGFDKDNDPIIWENGTDIAAANWRNRVEVISESR